MREQPQIPEDYDALQELMEKHNLLSLFQNLTFREKVRKVLDGLKAPKDSGDYKYARLQVQRLSAPVGAVIVPILGVLVLSLMAGLQKETPRGVEAQVIEPEKIEELEEEPPEEIEEIIEQTEPVDMEFTDVSVPSEVDMNAPAAEFSPAPAPVDAVAIVKSPITMKGIMGNRNPGMRGQAMGRFGGGGTNIAVMRALRWLKMQQLEDGSWPEVKPAMTALALLVYLAHGETPGDDKEFGPTVEKAIRWLVDNQQSDGLFKGKGDGHNYSHPIATYALCEAYALTRVPKVKDAAEKALEHVLNGQTSAGGWDYNMKSGSTRNDTSYMGWCAQAVKAAKMAGLEHPKLNQVFTAATKGFKRNAHESGRFGYTDPGGAGGLTGVGVLCLQLLGDGKSPEVERGLEWINQNTPFNWDNYYDKSPIYYWYYATQAMFHAGGTRWENWNAAFKPTLLQKQVVEKGVYPGGKDVGYWDSPSEQEHHKGGERIMDTCLCTLQLEVYYRYLPTFMTPKAIVEDEDFAEEVEEIEIEISI